MFRFSFLSCRLFFFTYAQSFFTTSVRGSGLSPTIFASAAEGCMAFMNAALGLRAVFFAAGFLAAFLAAIFVIPPRGSRSPLEIGAHSDRGVSSPSSGFSLGDALFLLWGLLTEVSFSLSGTGNPQHRRAFPSQQYRQRGVFGGGL